MRYEYATTYGDLYRGAVYDRGMYDNRPVENERLPDAPTEPDGDGWEFLGGTASTKLLYWFWRRPQKQAKKGQR